MLHLARQTPHQHYIHRIGWLRAAVLGANDGIVSMSSLIVGMVAAGAVPADVILAGVASLVAGAVSMAAGEYISVSSQADTEAADLRREIEELAVNPEYEHAELSSIYVQRGLTKKLADQVATQLMQHNALVAHARDELGISHTVHTQPLMAALSSAAAFAAGGILPVVSVAIIAHA